MPSPAPSFMSGNSYSSHFAAVPCKPLPNCEAKESCSRSAVYYPETQQSPRNYGMPRPNQLPHLSTASTGSRHLVSSPEDQEASSRKRKRHESPEEQAVQHAQKMRVRKSLPPGIPSTNSEDVHVPLPSNPVDIFAGPPSMSSTYVPGYLETSPSTRSAGAPYQDDFQASGQSSYSLPQPHAGTYSMAPMNLSTLAYVVRQCNW